MTETEFETWYADYCHTFPGTLVWLNDLGAEMKAHQKQVWRKALSAIELADAKAVTARIANGDEPPVPAYERELTGATIRRIASALVSERNAAVYRRRDEATHFASRGSEESGVSLGGLYRDILSVLDKGGTNEDALRLINARFPDESPDRQRRYRCPKCLDRRFIYVWSGLSVKAVIDGKINSDPAKRRVATVHCECSRGERERAAEGKKDRHPLSKVYFDAAGHCICPGGDVDCETNIDTLVAWVTRKQEHPELDCENYEPAFAAYNDGF